MSETVIFTDRLTKAFSGKEVIRSCQMSVIRVSREERGGEDNGV